MSFESTPGESTQEPGEAQQDLPRMPGAFGPPPFPGQPGYAAFPPGYGQGAVGAPSLNGAPPPSYQVWAWITAAGGVLFSLILGLPCALVAVRNARKVKANWQSGNVQAAMSASRRARTWAIVATVLDVLGVALAVVLVSASGASSSSNFSNPAAVAASIKSQLQTRISDPTSQYYVAGLKVTSVVCTRASSDTDHCVDYFSNGQTVSETAVISANGQSYVTH